MSFQIWDNILQTSPNHPKSRDRLWSSPWPCATPPVEPDQRAASCRPRTGLIDVFGASVHHDIEEVIQKTQDPESLSFPKKG